MSTFKRMFKKPFSNVLKNLGVICLALRVHCSRAPSRSSSVDASTPQTQKVESVPFEDATHSLDASWPKVFSVVDPGLNDLELEERKDASVSDTNMEASVADATQDALASLQKDTGPALLLGVAVLTGETETRGIRKITVPAAIVRKAPRTGEPIATVPKGTEIHLVAEFTDWYRVTFLDPVRNVHRYGWVHSFNFAGPQVTQCPANWEFHRQGASNTGWCDRECKRNTDCKDMRGYKCSGSRCFFAAD